MELPLRSWNSWHNYLSLLCLESWHFYRGTVSWTVHRSFMLLSNDTYLFSVRNYEECNMLWFISSQNAGPTKITECSTRHLFESISNVHSTVRLALESLKFNTRRVSLILRSGNDLNTFVCWPNASSATKTNSWILFSVAGNVLGSGICSKFEYNFFPNELNVTVNFFFADTAFRKVVFCFDIWWRIFPSYSSKDEMDIR